jgi:hypothetical protein
VAVDLFQVDKWADEKKNRQKFKYSVFANWRTFMKHELTKEIVKKSPRRTDRQREGWTLRV